jgi:hypothetical protein
MAPKRDETWVSRGILSACECFSCANKVSHRFKEANVAVLCRDPCHYRSQKGETRPPLEKLTDIEQVYNSYQR